jgi:hypothetical protein
LNFIFGIVCLFVCVCAFSLRQESPDMILGDKTPSFLRWFCHSNGVRWCVDKINPTAPPSKPIYTSSNPRGRRLCWPLGPPAGPTGMCHTPLWAVRVLVAGSVSFKEIGPLLLMSLLFSVYLVCSLKFCLNLKSNLVSISTNLCNLVEYFCNIVIINF